MSQDEKAPGPPPIVVLLPDGQEIRARLHARRRVRSGWQYQVGVLVWRDGVSGNAEPTEHRAWVSPEQARPVPGASYEQVPIHHSTPTAYGGRPGKLQPAWTVQQLPHLPGHPGATLVHVIGCVPGGHRLGREQALAALGQPRAAACKECDAAGSLAAGEGSPP
ncbi:DUF6233 domain-containing protein [Streptomyces sp. NPDC002917]|uniref:DUF6233 domain-containing protein n=1 Tax=Streptomyces sp. NPDC002917 TaxID=3364671 RepID=UPI0036CFDEF2